MVIVVTEILNQNFSFLPGGSNQEASKKFELRSSCQEIVTKRLLVLDLKKK